MDTFLQDVRFAARTLRKSPGFTLLAAVCLALGIGVNTTIFSTLDGALWRPFPFPDPDRLVVLRQTNSKAGIDRGGVSYPNFVDWREQARSFQSVAALTERSHTLSDGGEEPERMLGASVSWNLFPMLGATPLLGRTFREEEDRPGGEPVVIIGHTLWLRRFHGDPGIVGRPITVNGVPRTVVGVMRPKFEFPERQQIWTPLAPTAQRDDRSQRGLWVFARLRPDVSVREGEAELRGIAARLAGQYPRENAGWGARVLALHDDMVSEDTRLIIFTMMGAVSFVLLIACANVANLTLARASARNREIAVRVALGAGRARIVRQLLTESLMVALLGGVLGVAVAKLGLDFINAAFPPSDLPPYFIEFGLTPWVLAYTVAVALATGVLFGLAPALDAARGKLHESLKEGGRGAGGGAGRNRFRSWLVVGEVALSLVLLVGASLFVRTFLNLKRATGGFDSAGMMTMRLYMPGDRYAAPGPKARRVEDILRRIGALPGVVAVTASNTIALSTGGNDAEVEIEGRPVERDERPSISFVGAAGRWFRTHRMPITAGRDFTDAELGDSTPVTVISEATAKRFWPGASPLGRRLRFTGDTAAPWLTVVGMVPDIALDELDPQVGRPPAAYVSYRFFPANNTAIIIRTAGDPAAITPLARREIRASDPALPIFEVQTMEEVRRLGFWQYELFGQLFGAFGAIALALAAIGVYGVISYGVSQRTREIGVRVALGAQRGDVLRMVIGRGLALAGAGVGLGLLGALSVTRVVKSMLYNVSPTDPLSFLGIAAFLTVVALVASYVPARRATRVDPVTALRAE